MVNNGENKFKEQPGEETLVAGQVVQQVCTRMVKGKATIYKRNRNFRKLISKHAAQHNTEHCH